MYSVDFIAAFIVGFSLSCTAPAPPQSPPQAPEDLRCIDVAPDGEPELCATGEEVVGAIYRGVHENVPSFLLAGVDEARVRRELSRQVRYGRIYHGAR